MKDQKNERHPDNDSGHDRPDDNRVADVAAPIVAPDPGPAEEAAGFVEPAHQCFSVSATSYLRNLDRDDRHNECFAVHYQRPPVKVEGGTRHSLTFPMLVVSLYFENQQGVADKVARILNKHWDDEE